MKTDKQTIFALSTAIGKSGVAIIRISGPEVLSVLVSFGYNKPLAHRYATHTKIYSHLFPGELLDDALLIYFKSPNSFTGEDVLELHLHGSIAVVNAVLKELSALSFLRIAEPGEFTRRAFDNNKLSLVEVEALSDLIDSETELQRKLALRQLSGELKNTYENWRNKMISIMAQLEAYIDFPDDDIPQHVLDIAYQNIQKLINELQLYLNRSEISNYITHGVNISIIGPPNVGKSSLLNCIAQRDIAIVSELAGTTRDVLQVKVDLFGLPVIFSDTAGIRSTQDIIEQEGVKRAKISLNQSDIALIILDISDNITQIDQLFTLLSNNNKPNSELDLAVLKTNKCLFVLNKTDLTNLDEINKLATIYEDILINNGFQKPKIITLSTHNAYGLNELFTAIKSIIGYNAFCIDEPIISKLRQKANLEECIYYLTDFNLSKPLELAAQDIRFAAAALASITGNITLDEVLDQIFSSFCIGK